jgi:hypothetical protein
MDSPFSLSLSIVDWLQFFTFFITMKLLPAEATEAGRLKFCVLHTNLETV